VTHDWTSSAFRDALAAVVRRRVPARDAEDVVQAVLLEALVSTGRPAEPAAARRWIWGVARNKVADYHRRGRRETFEPPELIAPERHDGADDLLRWAIGELPPDADAAHTLAWLMREADGETLEEIARGAKLPADQVRQRVSRMRRMFRARWAVVAAAMGLVALIAFLATRKNAPRVQRGTPGAPWLAPDNDATARLERGRGLRARALEACADAHWTECVRGLDDARALDPAGDNSDTVRAAREAARRALRVRPTAPVPRAQPRAHAPLGLPSMIGPPDTSSSLGDSSMMSSGPRRSRRAATSGDGGASVPRRPTSLSGP